MLMSNFCNLFNLHPYSPIPQDYRHPRQEGPGRAGLHDPRHAGRQEAQAPHLHRRAEAQGPRQVRYPPRHLGNFHVRFLNVSNLGISMIETPGAAEETVVEKQVCVIVIVVIIFMSS